MEQEVNQIEKINEIIGKLDGNDFNIYFFTIDTKGNPVASVANIYEHVKVLNENGYNAFILHEKNDYKLHSDGQGMGISEWLGDEYANLPHVSIESQTLKVSPQDFLVIPEVFSNVMDQVKAFPCKKIVFCQSYSYALEILPIGKKWADMGFTDIITTSEKQSNQIRRWFPLSNIKTIPVSIPEYFKPPSKPKMPVISIVSRNQGDAVKIAKSFYLQYPIYKWLTFKELRNLPRTQFAEELSKCCLSVWVDEVAGFGTFPIESIKCETPVIGVIPNLIPEWMEAEGEDGNKTLANGIWVQSINDIPDLIATYIKLWLDDTPPEDLFENMAQLKDAYNENAQKDKIIEVFSQLKNERINEFNNQLQVVTNAK